MVTVANYWVQFLVAMIVAHRLVCFPIIVNCSQLLISQHICGCHCGSCGTESQLLNILGSGTCCCLRMQNLSSSSMPTRKS
jgi:hypothetical protein